MLERIWDTFVEIMTALFMPLVCSYFTLTSSVFFNVAAEDAKGLEKMSNLLFSPVHYVLAGQQAKKMEDGSWEFVQRFDYKEAFWVKTAACVALLPPSAVLGSTVKALSLCQKDVQKRYSSLVTAKQETNFSLDPTRFAKLGLDIGEVTELFVSQKHVRRKGDENVLHKEKLALKEITDLLNKAGITWWVDCGTCLGAYRYGGVIPWDEDVDIAVLLPDFKYVRKTLNKLDPSKYIVQDWSTRDLPNSYFKVFIRETGSLIDIYHFEVLPETKELRYVFSLGTNSFFPNWWKVREGRFTAPVAFDVVFPLKRAEFDGIEVFVPNDPKTYLQRCYGEDLNPVKIYNPQTDRYEKDLSHPYWQKSYVH